VRKRKRKFQAVPKLNMQKAYDRVEWDFLCDYMLKLGFSERWVSLVKQCISSVSFRINVNEELCEPFLPTRGIRQGDLLSLYLFIIMANLLSFLMTKVVEDGTVRGIKLNSSCLILSHLLFSNDAIFFLDGITQEAHNIASILN